MTPENFVYWLQGYFELQDAYITTLRVEYLDKAQVQLIKDHLKLVLEKKTAVRLPYSFSPPIVDTNGMINSEVHWGYKDNGPEIITTGIATAYFPNNSPSPPASC